MSKLLLTAVAFAALVTSPAFARSRDHQQNTGHRSTAVYDTSGHYVGSDPDPNVRMQLRDDPSQGGN